MKFSMPMFQRLERVLNGAEDDLVCGTVSVGKQYTFVPANNQSFMFDMRMFRRDTKITYLKNAVKITREPHVASSSIPRLVELLNLINCLVMNNNTIDVNTVNNLRYDRDNIPIIMNYLNSQDHNLGKLNHVFHILFSTKKSNNYQKKIDSLLGTGIMACNVLFAKRDKYISAYDATHLTHSYAVTPFSQQPKLRKEATKQLIKNK